MEREKARRGPRKIGEGSEKPDQDVVKVHGVRSTEEVMSVRPEAVVRAYVDQDQKKAFGTLLKALAKRRIAYRLIHKEELERVSASQHHEGVCLLVKPRASSWEAFVAGLGPSCSVVLLDGVQNPHNAGAIIRTAAHFDVPALFGSKLPLAGALARVAEGGLEHVQVFNSFSLSEAAERLRNLGFFIVGANQNAEASLFATRLPRRVAWVLGAERDGLSKEASSLLDQELTIPGSGEVESLNVSTAAAILLSEWYRQRLEKSP